MPDAREPIQKDDADDRLPRSLIDELAVLYGEVHAVPAPIDASIRAAARGHFHRLAARRRTLRLLLGWGGGIAAAAAGLVLAVRFFPGHSGDGTPRISLHAPAGPLDLNGDGKVDVLDAFYLARQLKAGAATDSKWDVNGDGVVDQRDVDAIAAQAVALQRRGTQ